MLLHSMLSVFEHADLRCIKEKKLIRVLVIIHNSSISKSTPGRLQIVYLSEMTHCQVQIYLAVLYHSALEPNIYFYRCVEGIAFSVWRRGGVSPSNLTKKELHVFVYSGGWIGGLPLFCSLPTLTGSVWLPQARVGNSGALCEAVRSLRPETAPFFADPWQQICGNDIVSCWVITHNSDCHILQSLGKNGGERKKELHWSTEGKWHEKCLPSEVLCWKRISLLQDTEIGVTALRAQPLTYNVLQGIYIFDFFHILSCYNH